MRGTAAGGQRAGEEGSFSNARALSGYVHTADDEPLVSSSSTTSHTADVVEQTMDQSWSVSRAFGARQLSAISFQQSAFSNQTFSIGFQRSAFAGGR